MQMYVKNISHSSFEVSDLLVVVFTNEYDAQWITLRNTILSICWESLLSRFKYPISFAYCDKKITSFYCELKLV